MVLNKIHLFKNGSEYICLFYDASAEVQTYLTSLRREKGALELLIHEIVVGDLFAR